MIDRTKLYGEMSTLDRAFCDRVIDQCEFWARNKNVAAMDPMEVHDTLKQIIMQEEISYRGGAGVLSYIPQWLWMWMLGKVVSFIIKWWLENRISNN